MNFQEAQNNLVTTSHELHARGWVPATSGNFSRRLDDGQIAITASGNDKGKLTVDDIMRVALDGRALDARKPSAETALHTQLYRRDESIRCVLHTHSVSATLISERNPAGLSFKGLEILKAFTGIDTHAARLRVPVFPNTQNIDQLAEQVEAHMQAQGQGVAYLISGHGLYTWGAHSQDCLRQLEALEFLFDYHWQSHNVAGQAKHQQP